MASRSSACSKPAPHTVVKLTRAATNGGALAGPPSTKMALTSAVKLKTAGKSAAGSAATPHGTATSSGMAGTQTCASCPAHAPMKMTGKICPPTKPKPDDMPMASILTKSVATSVVAPRLCPSETTVCSWTDPSPNVSGAATESSPHNVPPTAGSSVRPSSRLRAPGRHARKPSASMRACSAAPACAQTPSTAAASSPSSPHTTPRTAAWPMPNTLTSLANSYMTTGTVTVFRYVYCFSPA
mmetsp:Transcript_2673/g.7203  ORF Transcript_2673/g.7203 Transcript_2673/m.7203 type:complete len:241 (-) Transcript_2673:353-1075(-)